MHTLSVLLANNLVFWGFRRNCLATNVLCVCKEGIVWGNTDWNSYVLKTVLPHLWCPWWLVTSIQWPVKSTMMVNMIQRLRLKLMSLTKVNWNLLTESQDPPHWMLLSLHPFAWHPVFLLHCTCLLLLHLLCSFLLSSLHWEDNLRYCLILVPPLPIIKVLPGICFILFVCFSAKWKAPEAHQLEKCPKFLHNKSYQWLHRYYQ